MAIGRGPCQVEDDAGETRDAPRSAGRAQASMRREALHERALAPRGLSVGRQAGPAEDKRPEDGGDKNEGNNKGRGGDIQPEEAQTNGDEQSVALVSS